MPDTPASIISLNFDPKGLSETKQGAKELEGIFGRIGGLAEGFGKTIAGLAGVAGIGAIVHDFLRIEQSATRTALAVNNIRGGNSFYSALTGAQGKTGVDAVDLAGGINASQRFAGGGFLRNPGNAGAYGTFLGHMSQATGLDATSLGALLGQGLSIQGQSFSQQGAQSLLSQAYTASARAGQGGMTGDFLSALTGLVNSTGFFGRGSNMRGMSAAMGAAMAGDAGFANPSVAAGAVGSVEQTLQGSLTNPRMMAALQMSGANINDILSGNFSAAQKLAHFAKKQGPLASKLFFYSTFGQQGGRLMEDLANGKVNPQQFAHQMKQADPQQAMKQLMDRASAQEKTGLSELKKFEGNVLKDLGGPLKHIESMLAGVLGHKGLIEGALGLWGGSKLLRAAKTLGGGRLLGGLGARVLGPAGTDAAEALGLGAGGAGLAALLGVPAAAAGGLDIGSHIADAIAGKHNLKHTGPLGLLRRFKSNEELDLSHLDSLKGGLASGYRKSHNKEAYLKAMLHDYAGDGSEVGYQIVVILSKLLEETRKQKGGGNVGASYMMPGNTQGGAATGNIMASFAVGGGGAALAATSLFPGGVGPLGGGGAPDATGPASYTTPSGGGPATGGGWKDCVLTWYDPGLGGTNSGDGKRNPHEKTASGEPYDAGKYTCAAPSSYAFGTIIEFAYGGKTIKCRVNDRGGGISGNHFDLSKSAGKYLGIGNSKAKFRVVSSGSSGTGNQKQHLDPGALTPGATAQPASVGGGSGGGDFGGMTLGGGFAARGSSPNVSVYLDNRMIEKSRHRARAM